MRLICSKTLSFFGHYAGSKIDFGRFDPMFAINAAPDRNAIPLGLPLVSVSQNP
jgi:hypothetical protein